MSEKLLLPEAQASVFQPRLAAWIGLNESILLQHVHYLAGKSDFGMVSDGTKWIRMTTEEWVKELPCFDERTIRRALDGLEDDGLIVTRTFSGRSKWYRVNYELLTTVDGPVERLQTRTKARTKASTKAAEYRHNVSGQNDHIGDVSGQNGQLHLVKMTSPSGQNDQLPRPLPRPLSKSLLPKGNRGDKPPVPGNKSESKNKLPPPQAVQVYRSVANRFPDKAIWEMIETKVGIAQEDLDFWGLVVRDYIACGFNKINIKAMLEYFDRRELPKTKQGRNGVHGNGSKSTGARQPGIITAAQGIAGDETEPADSTSPGGSQGAGPGRGSAGILSGG